MFIGAQQRSFQFATKRAGAGQEHSVSMKYTVRQKVSRYVICGGVSAFIEFAVFFLLSQILPTYASALASFICGLTTSFFLNKTVVFGSETKKQDVAKESGKFLLLGLVNSQISSLATVGLTLLIANAILAKVITMTMIAVWNYLIMDKLIFARQKARQIADK
jgi:putative flippase GtrA